MTKTEFVRAELQNQPFKIEAAHDTAFDCATRPHRRCPLANNAENMPCVYAGMCVCKSVFLSC